MDYKKDIQQMGMVSQRNSSGLVSFGVTLAKKCERLATAIYLVTNFLSDTEPMKSRLRALSIDFVRDASFVKNGTQGTEANVLERLHANIFETLSLLEIAFVAGLVSEMNFTILKREYASLRDTIEIKKASRESSTDSILGDNFFSATEPVHPEGRAFMSPSPRPDLESADSESTDSRLGRRPLGRYASSTAPRIVPKGHSTGQTTTTMSDRNTKAPAPRASASSSLPTSDFRLSTGSPRAITDVAKESRRSRILKLIKDNREVSIKDIVAYFPDLSEKTIQRELVAMSDSGVLKKSGERRWSRYLLA